MQALKDYALLLSAVETELRRAAEEQRYVSFFELHAIPDVARNSSGMQQVRDVIATMRKAGCTVQADVDAKDHKGGKVGYAWKAGATFSPLSKGKAGRKATKPVKPGPVQATQYAKPNPHEVELCIHGINLIAGINPVTGRIRITIE